GLSVGAIEMGTLGLPDRGRPPVRAPGAVLDRLFGWRADGPQHVIRRGAVLARPGGSSRVSGDLAFRAEPAAHAVRDDRNDEILRGDNTGAFGRAGLTDSMVSNKGMRFERAGQVRQDFADAKGFAERALLGRSEPSFDRDGWRAAAEFGLFRRVRQSGFAAGSGNGA